MKHKLPRLCHLLAVCLFVGSIPTHIILGEVAQTVSDPYRFAIYHKAKLILTIGLTASALATAVMSGLWGMWRHRDYLRAGWFRLKLIIVSLIAVNGGIILTPTARRMADMALTAHATGQALDPAFQGLLIQEAIAGGLNLVLIVVVSLAVYRPTLRRKVA